MVKLAGGIILAVASLIAAAGCSAGTSPSAASMALPVTASKPLSPLSLLGTPTTVGAPGGAKTRLSGPTPTNPSSPSGISASGANPSLPPPPPSLPPLSVPINPGREVKCSSLGLHGWEISQESIHDCWTLYMGGYDLNAKIASYWLGINPNNPNQGTISGRRPSADRTSVTVDVPPPSSSLTITKVNFDYVCVNNGSSDLLELNLNAGTLQPQANDCR